MAELNLSSLELALLAEFNLEMATAYDEVAEDPAAARETREAARESALHRRERARLLQAEAQRLSEYPTDVPGPLRRAHPGRYAGPERRTGERRVRERRRRSVAPGVLGHPDRRVNPDRRRHDRRQASAPAGTPVAG